MTTYPPAECGIGNYARELRRSLARVAPDIEVTVLAERTNKAPDSDAGVTRCFDRRGDWVDEIATAVAAANVEAIHVQHDDDHYGKDGRFIRLLERVRALGVRTIVTLHTVYNFTRFHRRLVPVCDRIVAHQRAGMADVLVAQGVPTERIELIPHGTPTLELPPHDEARARLGIPSDSPTALFFGFIHPGKNVHVAVQAFERVAIDIPNARLVIAGRMRNKRARDDRYADMLWTLMRRGIEAGRIIYKPGFIPDEEKPWYFAATDVLLLPHHQRYGSASGVLHEGLAARRAMMCSQGKKFAEAVEHLAATMPFAVPRPSDIDAWETGMEVLLGSVVERERAVALVEELADVTSWPASGKRHADLYRAVCAGIR